MQRCSRYVSSTITTGTRRLLSKNTSDNRKAPRKIAPLSHRSLIEVNGKDGGQLLQGLITNDMNTLNVSSNPLLYSMLLNEKGRIVNDLLIYKWDDEQYFMECDKSEDENLVNLLKRYKLRKKVDLRTRPDVEVCSVFYPDITITHGSYCRYNTLINNLDLDHETERSFKDPRFPQFGARVLINSYESLLQRVDSSNHDAVDVDVYHKHRYTLGVSEGIDEMAGGIPLQHNLEWLEGVKFDKGCYIGQESVARIHHTGQVRKRVMPLVFNMHVDEMAGASIYHSSGGKVGQVLACSRIPKQSDKLRNQDAFPFVGIGMINLKAGMDEESMSATTKLYLDIGGDNSVKVASVAPDWWPIWFLQNFKPRMSHHE